MKTNLSWFYFYSIQNIQSFLFWFFFFPWGEYYKNCLEFMEISIGWQNCTFPSLIIHGLKDQHFCHSKMNGCNDLCHLYWTPSLTDMASALSFDDSISNSQGKGWGNYGGRFCDHHLICVLACVEIQTGQCTQASPRKTRLHKDFWPVGFQILWTKQISKNFLEGIQSILNLALL